jgi:hypothetical protein
MSHLVVVSGPSPGCAWTAGFTELSVGGGAAGVGSFGCLVNGPFGLGLVLVSGLCSRWCPIGGGFTGGMCGQVPHGGVGHGEHRHRDEAADDAGDDDAGGDREDDSEGMQGDGSAHDQWLQDVAFQLLYRDHHGQDQKCTDRAVGDQRDQNGDRAGQRGADHGMKAPRNTSAASGSASGTRSTASPMPMPTASTNATSTVART